MTKLPVVAILFAGTAIADTEPSATVSKSVAHVVVPRNLADGTPAVKLAFTLPADWKLHDVSSMSGSVSFVPASAKYDRPSIAIYVPIDNSANDLDKRITSAQPAKDKKIVGGGTLVKLITDKKKLELGDKAHALVSSVEVDATTDRHVHYVETTCYAWKDGSAYAVLLHGFAEMQDAKLVSEFERACASIKLD